MTQDPKIQQKLDVATELATELFTMMEAFRAQQPKKVLRQDSRFRRWEALMQRWYEAQ